MGNLNLVESLIANNSINVKVKVKSWQEAIIATFKPLVNSGAVEPRYAQAVIDSALKNGPYFIVDQKVAMPHARPEDGVNKNCFSLVTLDTPVSFEPDQRKIGLLIGLGATSAEVHVSNALPQVVALIENQQTQEALMNAKSKEAIISLIKKEDLSKYL